MKARHEKELNDLRTRMQREIDQSINELKMTSDIRRMEAIEAQVNISFFIVLILCVLFYKPGIEFNLQLHA